MLSKLKSDWLMSKNARNARRRWSRPSCSLCVEQLEYRTLLSAVVPVSTEHAPVSSQHPVFAQQPDSSGNTGSANDSGNPPGTAFGGTSGPSAPGSNQVSPANNFGAAPNAQPGSSNPTVEPLLLAESGQTLAAVTAFSLGSNPAQATPPYFTGNVGLAVASTVNSQSTQTAGESSVGNASTIGTLNMSGGSNMALDATGPRNLDQYWSTASQQLVTGGFMDALGS